MPASVGPATEATLRQAGVNIALRPAEYVAEAIIAGKPVACSNVTSLPEIGGDAAVMFDPLDVEAMAARILEIATNAELRASLAAAARRRRAVFSASLSAIKTLAVYETVIGKLSGTAA